MTREEASALFQFPKSILHTYDHWVERRTAQPVQNYGEDSLPWLNLLLTLSGIGITGPQAERYLDLQVQGWPDAAERILLLEKRRAELLETVHHLERQREYLRELQKEIESGTL